MRQRSWSHNMTPWQPFLSALPDSGESLKKQHLRLLRGCHPAGKEGARDVLFYTQKPPISPGLPSVDDSDAAQDFPGLHPLPDAEAKQANDPMPHDVPADMTGGSKKPTLGTFYMLLVHECTASVHSQRAVGGG